MNAFDNSEFESYKAEVQERWGSTDAYQEHTERTKGYSKNQWQNVADGLNDIFAQFALCMKNGEEPQSGEAQALVAAGIPLENENGRLYRFIQRNKVSAGEGAEVISPGKIGVGFLAEELYSPTGEVLPSTPHPSMIYWCRVPFAIHEGDIMRAASGKGLEKRAKDRLKGDC